MNSWRTSKTSKNTFQRLWFTGFSVRPYTWWVGGCQHLSFCGLVHQKSTPPKNIGSRPEAVTHENLTQVLELTVMTLEWASMVGGEDVRLVLKNSGKRNGSEMSFIHKQSKTSSQQFWLFTDAHFMNTLNWQVHYLHQRSCQKAAKCQISHQTEPHWKRCPTVAVVTCFLLWIQEDLLGHLEWACKKNMGSERDRFWVRIWSVFGVDWKVKSGQGRCFLHVALKLTHVNIFLYILTIIYVHIYI